MNGYLVVLRQQMEDFPVRFIEDRIDAMNFADDLDPFLSGPLREIYKSDGSEPYGVMVLRFRDGVPVERAYDRDLTEEE